MVDFSTWSTPVHCSAHCTVQSTIHSCPQSTSFHSTVRSTVHSNRVHSLFQSRFQCSTPQSKVHSGPWYTLVHILFYCPLQFAVNCSSLLQFTFHSPLLIIDRVPVYSVRLYSTLVHYVRVLPMVHFTMPSCPLSTVIHGL